MKALIGIIIFLEGVLLISCTGNQRLHHALEEAGPNRGELEKVLVHYKDSDLKYKAACFLIEGMPGRFAYKSETIDSLKLLKAMSVQKGNGVWTDSVLNVWNSFSYTQQAKLYDIHIITADYLIRHIDSVFKIWNSRPWAKYYSFEDFCRWVLPYRIDDEPLEEWYETYHQQYSPLLDSIYQGTDIVEAAFRLNNVFKQQNFKYSTDFSLPHMGAKFLLEHPVGTCRESCDLTIYALRALGIPIHYDYYKASPYVQHGHQWTVLKDTTGLIVPFWFREADPKRGGSDGRKKGKVFRKLYGSMTTEDVTSEYFGHNRAKIEIDATVQEKEIYLSVYEPGGFTIVDKGVRKGKEVTFYDIEPEIRFQPLTLKEGKQQIAGYAFALQHDGSVHYYKPDTLHTISAKLYRKYPYYINMKNYIGNMTNAKFEVSNSSDFATSRELCVMSDSIKTSYNYYYPSISEAFRYVRLTPPDSMNLEIGEIAFYHKPKDEESLGMKIISKLSVHNPKQQPSNMFDGDGLTYYWEKEKGRGVIFDLGKKVSIGKILFTPRNDDNFIRIGDTYELFYQDGIKGWRSLGKQTAMTGELVYNNIPSGALLLLRDYTRGKEEQQFEIRDGKQYFY